MSVCNGETDAISDWKNGEETLKTMKNQTRGNDEEKVSLDKVNDRFCDDEHRATSVSDAIMIKTGCSHEVILNPITSTADEMASTATPLFLTTTCPASTEISAPAANYEPTIKDEAEVDRSCGGSGSRSGSGSESGSRSGNGGGSENAGRNGGYGGVEDQATLLVVKQYASTASPIGGVESASSSEIEVVTRKETFLEEKEEGEENEQGAVLLTSEREKDLQWENMEVGNATRGETEESRKSFVNAGHTAAPCDDNAVAAYNDAAASNTLQIETPPRSELSMSHPNLPPFEGDTLMRHSTPRIQSRGGEGGGGGGGGGRSEEREEREERGCSTPRIQSNRRSESKGEEEEERHLLPQPGKDGVEAEGAGGGGGGGRGDRGCSTLRSPEMEGEKKKSLSSLDTISLDVLNGVKDRFRTTGIAQ